VLALPSRSRGRTPLPGARVVDDALVRRVVDGVNAIELAHGLDRVRALGRVVVDALFGGDVARFRTEAKAHRSFRALARHDDLLVSASALWYAIAIYEQLHLLPADLCARLSVTHHRRLLGLRDLTARTHLARRAVEGRWSVRRLDDEVGRARHAERDRPRGGRPRLTPSERTDRMARRFVAALEGTLLDAARRADADEIARIRASLAATARALDAEVERLGEAYRRSDGISVPPTT
jgi:hypothetical protein